MALSIGSAPVIQVAKGSTNVNKIYKGDSLVWAKPSLPQIDYFDGGGHVSSLTRATFTLRWRIKVEPGATYRIDRDGVDIIPAGTALPQSGTGVADGYYSGTDEETPTATSRYTLTVTNGGQSVATHFTFYVNPTLTITNMAATANGQVAAGFNILQRMRLTATINGNPSPTSVTLSADPVYPSNHQFGEAIRHLSGTAFSTDFTASVGGENTHSRRVRYTLTARNAAGQQASASAYFDWGNA